MKGFIDYVNYNQQKPWMIRKKNFSMNGIFEIKNYLEV